MNSLCKYKSVIKRNKEHEIIPSRTNHLVIKTRKRIMYIESLHAKLIPSMKDIMHLSNDCALETLAKLNSFYVGKIPYNIRLFNSRIYRINYPVKLSLLPSRRHERPLDIRIDDYEDVYSVYLQGRSNANAISLDSYSKNGGNYEY